MTHCVVSLSGGIGSWAAGDIAIDLYGADNVTMLFADTLIEDEDLYRFLEDIERRWAVPIVRIAEGRTPWEVFNDSRFIGNSMVDPCSRILKRELLHKWIDEHHAEGCDVAFGIDYTEAHRCEPISRRYVPHHAVFPLIDRNVDKNTAMQRLRQAGIDPPELYAFGFPHNNCGGFCVKAGQAQFALLLRTMPERYREHELQEEALRTRLGKDVAIMRDRSIAVRVRRAHDLGLAEVPSSVPLTMHDFRIRVDRGDRYDDEWGGCGCALDDEPSQLTLDLFGTAA